MDNPLMRSVVINAVLTMILIIAKANGQCTIYVAPGGNDGNPGTISSPLATPTAAVQSAPAGSVVCLRAGQYALTSGVVITKSLTLRSYPNEIATLTASTASSSLVTSVVTVAGSNVSVQDLEIIGGSYYGIHVSTYGGTPPANVRIQRCKVHNVGYIGIKAYMADSLLVEDSEVYSTGMLTPQNAEGIDVMAAIPAAGDPLNRGAIVRGNYVHDVASFGIYLKAGTQRGLIERNRVERTAAGGIIIGGTSGVTFMRNGAQYECIDCIARNNVVSETQGLGLGCWAGLNGLIVNNTAVNVAKTMQAGLHTSINDLGMGCTNTRVENNTFVVSSSRPMVHLIRPGQGMNFESNAYFNTLGTYAFWLETATSDSYWNYDGWKANTGWDTRSIARKDPLLDPAQLFRLKAGSPLIDAGLTEAEVPTDYSGVLRPQGLAYDIGAHEFESQTAASPCCLAAVTSSGQTTTVGTAFGVALQVQALDSSSNPMAGVAVTFSAPSVGASATFSGNPTAVVTTDASGVATAPPLTANLLAGTYVVTVSAVNYSPVAFSLTNNPVIIGVGPVISGLPAPGSCTIWPPNKRMVTVATVTAKEPNENGSGLALGSLQITVTSNEPQLPERPDVLVQNGVVQVRADRLGGGNGRVYTITAVASDVAGNRSTATGQCTVPKSQGQ